MKPDFLSTIAVEIRVFMAIGYTRTVIRCGGWSRLLFFQLGYNKRAGLWSA